MCVGRSVLVSGTCLLRSKVRKLWKGDIEVNVEYGESLMSTENCIKLMDLRICFNEVIFLITLWVFMLMIKSMA